MAWQLIYTSAPRLLEAGRTGFGTVARHRSVGGMLAAAVERFSQFARLPGHDPKRVVFSYRIVTVGASAYHVLSRLRDAGSDYTGRTNHIAHHLIAEAEEVQGLEAAGITPADVLLVMPWRDAWTEGARFLDAGEEINLGTLKARPSQAWQQVTGDRRHAWLPWSSDAHKGCYLITPDDAPVLELVRESLNETIDQAWGATFTTSLEPNDEVSDFRWIAVAASSPLRVQAEASSRQVFDLTNLASLPPPPEDVPLMPVIPRAGGPASSPARESLPPPSARRREGAVPPPSASSSRPPAEHGAMGGWSPEPRVKRRAQKSMLPLVLAGVVALLACATGVVWFQLLQKQRQEDTDRLTEEIESTWKQHQLLLQTTKGSLKVLAAEPDKTARTRAQALLTRYRQAFDKIDLYLENPDMRQALRFPDERQHDDFVDLCQEVEQWPAAASVKGVLTAWGQQQASPKDMLTAFEEWREQRKDRWRRFAVFFDASRAMPQNKAAVESLLARVTALLQAEKKPGGKPQDWQRLIEEVAQVLKDSPPGLRQPGWLATWTKLEDLGVDATGTGIQEVCTQLEALKDVPAWLKTAAADRKKKTEEMLIANKRPLPKPPPAPKPKAAEVNAEQVDAFDAKHPIFLKWVAADEKDTGITVAALAGETRPKIRFGAVSADYNHLEEWNFFDDSYRLKLMVKDKGEVKIHGQEITLPALTEGSRLVALSADSAQVLFEVRLFTPASNLAELLKFSNVPKFQATEVPGAGQTLEIGSLLRRLQFGSRPVATFHLISTEGQNRDFELLQPDAEKDTYVVKAMAMAIEVQSRGQRRKKMEEDIKSLKDKIKKDEAEIAQTESSRLAKVQKAQKLESLRASKALKETQLAAKEAELRALDAESNGPPPRLTENRYHLRARFGSYDSEEFKDLCVIHINVPTKAP